MHVWLVVIFECVLLRCSMAESLPLLSLWPGVRDKQGGGKEREREREGERA